MHAPILAVVLLCQTACGAVHHRGATVERQSIETKDGVRHYDLYDPGKGGASRPLVILLHGHMGSADQVMGLRRSSSPMSVWLKIADREGLVVAALDGAKGPDGKQGWNDGRTGATGNPTTDDVAFTQAVIDRLVKEDGVDPRRVFLMGMSNGGIMTFRLALELKTRPAGFAAVCASMPPEYLAAKPAGKITALLIDGTADPLVPYGGGQVHFYSLKRGAVASIPQSVDFWVHADGLSPDPAESKLTHSRPLDPTRATVYRYGDASGTEVVHVKIDGGGHVEPSPSQTYGGIYRGVVGKQNHDLETAQFAWDLFKNKRATD